MAYHTLIFDLEADNLLPDVSTVHCIVLRGYDGDHVMTFKPNQIEEAFEIMDKADTIVGHNSIEYDFKVLEKVYGWKWKKSGEKFDTLVATRTIYPNLLELDIKDEKIPKKLYGSHSLKAWGYRLGELKGDFNQGTESFETYSDDMLSYCIQDVQVTHKLYQRILSENFSQEALELEHNLHTLLSEQTERGFVFDVKKAESLFSTLASRKQEIETELVNTFEPNVIIMKTKTKELPFNPASRQQIADRLQRRGWKPTEFTPSGEPKVDETTLSSIDIPEAKLLQEYLILNKRLGQLATGNQAWLKLQKEGKLHGRVNHMGAVTSRCTHSNPNLGQVPSLSATFGKECRSLFTVPSGYSLLGADASGLELRCLANFMARYDSGKYSREILEGDIHTTNQKAAGLETRSQAKTFIYGFLYGAGDEKVGSIIGRGVKEGRAIKKRFLQQTPALKRLRDAVNSSAEKGYILGLDKRRIPIRHAHASLNTLLQSAGALICKQWYVTIEKNLRLNSYTKEDVSIVAFVHDEVQLQVKKGLEEKVGTIITQAMHEVEKHYQFKCKLDSEYKYGQHWADTH